MPEPAPSRPSPRRVRAVLLGDRINTANVDRMQVICPAPLTYRCGADGYVTLFRYGVAALIGLTPAQEEEVLRELRAAREPSARSAGGGDRVRRDRCREGRPDPSRRPDRPEGADARAPHRHRRRLVEERGAGARRARGRHRARSGRAVRTPARRERHTSGRRDILRHIGKELLVQHRVSGRVAVAEKPDLVWDRPDLERLTARLQDEYELKERGEALSRKLTVIADTAEVLTDIIDTGARCGSRSSSWC